MITLDFETFYDKDFSLSKLTTEEYVRDERFEVIGVAVKVGDEQTQWFSGDHEATRQWLLQFPWADHFVLAHNAMFDAAIMTWRFDIRPKAWLDTLSMARAVLGPTASVSLAKLVEHFGIGVKGHEVEDAKGYRRADFTPQHLAQYAGYCVNDVELTYKLFRELDVNFPVKEKKLIDLTIRMFSDPVLELDEQRLKDHLRDVQERKQRLFLEANITPETLNSNKKFAALLESFGVTPPMKISPTTNKETYAFAKSDEDFLRLHDHPDERVQAVVAARLGAKSTLEETRTQRFIDIAGHTPDHKLPIPLKYYAAHTGRWGGSDSVNLQNLPSRGEQRNKLKRCIVAPKGHVIIDCDSSQIEARVLAWLAGQTDVLTKFSLKQDVYRYMAALIYNKSETAVTDHERFIGKTTVLGCFAADTKVLTDGGWKRIVEVQSTDKVWDGEEWVTHMGVVPKGERETIRAWGVSATPEHEILTEHGWREWREVVTSPSLSRSAFSKARSLSSVGNNTSGQLVDPPDGIRAFDVTADGKVLLTATTLKQGALLGATPAEKSRRTRSGTGLMRLFSRMRRIVQGCSTASRLVLHDAITLAQRYTHTTAGAAYLCTPHGEPTVPRFFSIYSPCMAGTTPSAILIGSTTVRGTSREICGSLRAAKTPEINGQSVLCRQRLQTYDIAYAGPKNRFMIATDAGPLIVHNCGYGMGAIKFQTQLQNMGHKLDHDTCKHIIKQYRHTNTRISHWWSHLNHVLDWLLTNKASDNVDAQGLLRVSPFTGIELPSGMFINYPELRREPAGGYSYMTRQGRNRIYGGKVAENLCQAVARCVIGEQMLMIAKELRVVLTVHDAIACVVRESEAGEAQAFIEDCMRTAPKWAEGLPLNCESGVATTYGDC